VHTAIWFYSGGDEVRRSPKAWAKEEFAKLTASESGHRFRDRYRRTAGERHSLKRVVLIGFGVGLCIAGVLMLVFPGPGLVAILLGLGIMAGEVLLVARLLDWAEERGRTVVAPLLVRWERVKHKGIIGALLVLTGAFATTVFTLLVARILGTPLPFGLDTWPS
jgi:hypothetical protein